MSTTQLDTTEMTDYMERISAFAAVRLGVTLDVLAPV